MAWLLRLIRAAWRALLEGHQRRTTNSPSTPSPPIWNLTIAVTTETDSSGNTTTIVV